MIFVGGKKNNMNENKQIEELAATIYILFRSDSICRALASLLYEKGWRKDEKLPKDEVKSNNSGWISVKDAKPKENGIYCVMVANRKSHKYTKRTHARYKDGIWLDLYDNWKNACWIVTHWAPPPEPLEGE